MSEVKPRPSPQETQARVAKSLNRRYWAERRFRAYGFTAVLLGIGFVIFIFANIISKGVSVFRQANIELEVFYDPAVIDPTGTRDATVIADADYQALIRAGLRERFPNVEGRRDTREL